MSYLYDDMLMSDRDDDYDANDGTDDEPLVPPEDDEEFGDDPSEKVGGDTDADEEL